MDFLNNKPARPRTLGPPPPPSPPPKPGRNGRNPSRSGPGPLARMRRAGARVYLSTRSLCFANCHKYVSKYTI